MKVSKQFAERWTLVLCFSLLLMCAGIARAQEIASAVIYQLNLPSQHVSPNRTDADGQAIFDFSGRTVIFKFDQFNRPSLIGIYPFKGVCGSRVAILKDEYSDPGNVDGASLFTSETHQQLAPQSQTALARVFHQLRKLETSVRVTLPFVYGDVHGFEIPQWVANGGEPTDERTQPDGRAHLGSMSRVETENYLHLLHVPQNTIDRFFANDLSLSELEQLYQLIDHGLGVRPPQPLTVITNPPTNGHQEIVLHFNGKDYDRTTGKFLLRGMGMRDADIDRFFDNQLDLTELDKFWMIVRRIDPGATTMVKIQVQIGGEGGIAIPFVGTLKVHGMFEATVPLDHADEVVVRVNELRERVIGELQEAMQRYGEQLGQWLGDLANHAWERLQNFFGNEHRPWWFHLVP